MLVCYSQPDTFYIIITEITSSDQPTHQPTDRSFIPSFVQPNHVTTAPWDFHDHGSNSTNSFPSTRHNRSSQHCRRASTRARYPHHHESILPYHPKHVVYSATSTSKRYITSTQPNPSIPLELPRSPAFSLLCFSSYPRPITLHTPFHSSPVC